MIIEKSGDVLRSNALIIAHQVNCTGVMGAGIANQIRSRMLTNKSFLKYKYLCKEKGLYLLGSCLLLPRKDKEGRYIANLFGENIPTGKKLDTEYKFLFKSFQDLRRKILLIEEISPSSRITIAIPAYLGCGLAGGDWEIVFSRILLPLFQNSEETLIIHYLPESANRLWKEFRKIPVNAENGCIERGWHGFTPGTGVGYIYRWFDETFPEYF